MIITNKLTKTYRRRNEDVKAIDDASFEINSGDFISIIGPSGSGKSSLLLTLGGMLAPTSGTVTIDGESIYDLTPNERARLRHEKIGFVFQTFNLIPYLSALQNVQLPLLLGGKEEQEQKERAEQLLERVELGNRMDHTPPELSIGQQQRCALARMLANDPSIIFADEPTGNLDPETGKNMMSFFHELSEEGRTIIMVTHDMEIAKQSKRIFAIHDGKLNEVLEARV